MWFDSSHSQLWETYSTGGCVTEERGYKGIMLSEVTLK